MQLYRKHSRPFHIYILQKLEFQKILKMNKEEQ